jgi:hypothetical protein
MPLNGLAHMQVRGEEHTATMRVFWIGTALSTGEENGISRGVALTASRGGAFTVRVGTDAPSGVLVGCTVLGPKM